MITRMYKETASKSESQAETPRQSAGQAEYCYEPLPKGCIRLLRFSPNRHKGGLLIAIDHVSMHAAPPYVALSYAWGNPTSTKRLHVRNRGRTNFICVTRSLKQAIYALSAMLCSSCGPTACASTNPTLPSAASRSPI